MGLPRRPNVNVGVPTPPQTSQLLPAYVTPVESTPAYDPLVETGTSAYEQNAHDYGQPGDYSQESYTTPAQNDYSQSAYGTAEPTYGSQEMTYQEQVDTFYAEEEEEGEVFDLEQKLALLPDESTRNSVSLLLEEILSDTSSEVIMNGPSSIHAKRSGTRVHLTDINFKDAGVYHQVINDFILEFCDTKERIGATGYLIEGQLEMSDDSSDVPMIARVHVVAPPAVKEAKVTIAKKARRQLTLDDIYGRGAMSEPMFQFLCTVARGKLTTVLSGLSGSGKTTLLEAMSHYFDPDDRVVVAEDTPELRLPLPDVVSLVATKPKPGDTTKEVSLEWLVEQANRMRPDRIIVGETRGAEMSEFLIAANSGADGSMTTLHAQDAEGAWRKMVTLASKSGNGTRSENSIVRDIAGTVQIIIQTALIDQHHIITGITEVSNIVSRQTGAIALNDLFLFDRRTNTWRVGNRPSDSLQQFIVSRGAPYDPSWFVK